MMRNNSGFTLVELMVTIAVFTVLAAIAVPAVSNWLPDFKLKSAARDLLSTMQKARLQAVKENISMVVSFDPDADGTLNNDYIVFADSNNNSLLDAGERTVMRGEVPREIALYQTTLVNHQARYNNRGLLMGVNGTVHMRNANNTFLGVRMLITGISRIVRSDDNGMTWN